MHRKSIEQHAYVRRLVITIGLLLSFTFMAADVASAAAGPEPYPPGAVCAYWSLVKVNKPGSAPNCVNLRGNPTGSAVYHTTYSGWTYVTKTGALCTGWFQSWTGSGYRTVTGPNRVVTTSPTTWSCGILSVVN